MSKWWDGMIPWLEGKYLRCGFIKIKIYIIEIIINVYSKKY